MKRLLLLMAGLSIGQTIYAQNGESPITYKNLGLQFSTIMDNGDPGSAGLTSVSSFNGFGSYLDNPAAMALTDESFYSLGVFGNNSNQTSTYLGSESMDNFGSLYFSNVGFVYKMPTKVGSLVFGGGYNLISNEKTQTFLDAFNSNSTITDAYVDVDNDFNPLAYEAYAIEFGDATETYYESIFRLGLAPNEYRGITQIGDITNKKNLAEYSLFAATEFQRNFYVGVSIGLINGTSTFKRDFVELDDRGNYNDNILFDDGSGNGTDIYSITSYDENLSEILALSVRGGLLYRMGNNLQLGASVMLPSKLNVSEDYFLSIYSDFDDGTFTDEQTDYFEFDYAIIRPAQINIGATLKDIGKLSLSGAAEYIDYRTMKVDLTVSDYLTPIAKAELVENESLFNRDIENDYNMVTNLRAGATYELNEGFTLKGGYAYYPAISKIFNNEKYVISGGFGFLISENMVLDLSAQYSTWNDRSIVYSYSDPATTNFTQVPVDQKLESVNIIAGIRVLF